MAIVFKLIFMPDLDSFVNYEFAGNLQSNSQSDWSHFLSISKLVRASMLDVRLQQCQMDINFFNAINLQFFEVNFNCNCFALVKFKVNEQNFVTVIAITQQ